MKMTLCQLDESNKLINDYAISTIEYIRYRDLENPWDMSCLELIAFIEENA